MKLKFNTHNCYAAAPKTEYTLARSAKHKADLFAEQFKKTFQPLLGQTAEDKMSLQQTNETSQKYYLLCYKS